MCGGRVSGQHGTVRACRAARRGGTNPLPPGRTLHRQPEGTMHVVDVTMLYGGAGGGDNAVASERRRGACERLAELGLPEPIIVRGNFDYASGKLGLREIIARSGGRVPDAVICGSDVMAIGCLDCARQELGLAVPAQLSVAGFDAVEASSWLSYNLTTLRHPMQQMTAAAAELLYSLIDNPGGAAEKRMFAPQFVEGATARLAPVLPVAVSLAA
eukprot:gene32798-40481_t